MIYSINDLFFMDNHAGYKARRDIFSILEHDYPFVQNYNFYRFTPSYYKLRIFRILLRHIKLELNYYFFFFFIRKLQKEDIIFIQFPFECYFPITRKVFKLLKKKGFKIILLIHDLDSLRRDNQIDVTVECSLLNIATCIISHNESMTNWLVNNGILRSKIVNLFLFDYLLPNETNEKKHISGLVEKKIIFAGNLAKDKVSFLYDWNPKVKVDLYGINYMQRFEKPFFTYKGVFNADNPKIEKEGIAFGLVWDGNSVDSCDGITGRYLLYNNPHKVSFYLSQGFPVIVWNQSAISHFIVKENIGYVIERLDDIPTILDNVTMDKYRIFEQNVLKIKDNLNQGYFFKRAFDESLSYINNSKENSKK